MKKRNSLRLLMAMLSVALLLTVIPFAGMPVIAVTEENVMPLADPSVLLVANKTDLILGGENQNEVDEAELVTFTVSLANFPATKAIAVEIQYDPTVFEPVSGEWLVEGAFLKNFDVDTAKGAAAWTAFANVNGVAMTFTLKAIGAADASEVICRVINQLENSDRENVDSAPAALAVTCLHPNLGFMDKGETHSYGCLDCGMSVENADHEYENLCDNDCAICGHVRVAPHNFKEEWENDENGHWHACADCEVTTEAVAHAAGESKPHLCGDCEYQLYVPGDTNNDNVLSVEDVVTIVEALEAPETVEHSIDFNTDGENTVDDVLLLLYNLLFGDFYELYPTA